VQRSQILKLLIAAAFVAISGCNSAPEQTYSLQEWAEKQHPPSDKTTLPEGCEPVRYRGGFVPIIESIRKSGKNCVVHDFIQRQRYHAHDSDRGSQGNPGYEGVLSFHENNNIDLDLRGHIISGAPFEDVAGFVAASGKSDLRVHNGNIKTPGLNSIGVFMSKSFRYPPSGLPKYLPPEDMPHMLSAEYDPVRKAFTFSSPWDYQPSTRYTAENLHIQSGGRGIIMSGADNVVRNNVIEVDGKVAVYLYGPRPIIEGNTFIVKLSDKDKATLPAALKLRDADGAIIRNNRFIVQSSGFRINKAEAAINLLSSSNVLIENNIIENTSTLLRKDDVSSATERGNQLK